MQTMNSKPREPRVKRVYVDIGLNHGRVDQRSESRDLLDQERENNLVARTFDEADLAESLKRLGCQ